MADEGAGDNTYDATTNTYTAAAASTTAGLQKWSFNSSTGEWQLDYVLQSGLNLGSPYHVAQDRKGDQYPTGLNNTDSGTGLPWAPATDGLRGLTGRVNRNGTVSLWASTSTVSGSGDQGADPNKLVEITDNLAATSAGQVTQRAVPHRDASDLRPGRPGRGVHARHPIDQRQRHQPPASLPSFPGGRHAGAGAALISGSPCSPCPLAKRPALEKGAASCARARRGRVGGPNAKKVRLPATSSAARTAFSRS